MAFGFGHPHRSVPDARCQVSYRDRCCIILFASVIRFVERRVAFVSQTNKSKTEIAAPTAPERAQRLALFGPPPIIEGEDAAAYDQLLARICTAVKPVDIIEEMFTADVVSLEWEVLRLRRLKWSLIRLEALEDFLRENLDYSEDFADDLAQIIQANFKKGLAEDAQTLARACAHNEAGAVGKVERILADMGQNMDQVLDDTKGCKAKELVQKYLRRKPDAVQQVDELLTDAGVIMDGFMARSLRNSLDDIERIDRLTSIAESRRNASLLEIERRRAILGEKLRRSVQEIEDGEFEEIEPTPAQGKNVA